jgi:2-keto-4-pentenoate hydratase/2-oxohepta-3-ene-1,7-dioic acid hydratase in catechol pathway
LRPRGEKTLDWEVELGVVIGRTAQFVKREQALDYVFGYTIINDASARDFQFHTSQWSAGKIATPRRSARTSPTAQRSRIHTCSISRRG